MAPHPTVTGALSGHAREIFGAGRIARMTDLRLMQGINTRGIAIWRLDRVNFNVY